MGGLFLLFCSLLSNARWSIELLEFLYVGASWDDGVDYRNKLAQLKSID